MASSADARQLQFRGDFVETYIAANDLSDIILDGAELSCENKLCSQFKSVSICLCDNKERTQVLVNDYCDVHV